MNSGKDDQVSLRAYQIWQSEGRPRGRQAEHWRRAEAEWQGERRHYYELNWQDRRIWGVTAGILVNLSRRLNPAFGEP